MSSLLVKNALAIVTVDDEDRILKNESILIEDGVITYIGKEARQADREIRADGSDCFERYDPVSTGPNLLPWAELQYYRQFGDIDRLHRVFPALVAYAQWWKLNRTWKDGTYWSSGWGTGMDNMPRVPEGYI